MSATASPTTSDPEPTDAELIAAVRAQDTEAFAQLFARHRHAALRLSRQLVSGPDADDLVSESFLRVLSVLQDGGGPDHSFRAYLLTSIRRLHIDRLRVSARVRCTDDEAVLDRVADLADPACARFERDAATTAFTSLPERWQLVLWYHDVEGQRACDIAPLLGISPNNVSVLAYRAREGLRQAYLQVHLSPLQHRRCSKVVGLLGGFVRQGLSARDRAAVEDHLARCTWCAELCHELAEINSVL